MKNTGRNTFLGRFRRFVEAEKLFGPGEKILLAVSGGADSVVMANLFAEAGYNFGIAHCNFCLRGEESDGDENFVEEMAQKLGVQFHTIKFETKKYAVENRLSTQLAARELRYNWFSEISQKHDYKHIATAHHQNDFAETIILNLVKGAVLDGLNGIPVKNGNIIRPLLFATRAEIEAYIESNNFQFRLDSSNLEDKYQRNLIRNKVIPLLKQINPNLEETIFQSAKPRRIMAEWMKIQAKQQLNELVKTEAETQILSIYNIREKCLDSALLYIWLQEFGFTFSQVEDVFASIENTETQKFYSATHRLVKDRSEFVLQPLETKHFFEVLYMEKPEGIYHFGGLQFELKTVSKAEITNLKDPAKAYFDLQKTRFPLQVRSWKTGDHFYPFGLGKRKLLSDFFTDLKLSNREKENQLVLTDSEGKIMWVVGRRTDDRFKIDETTEQALRVTLSKQ